MLEGPISLLKRKVGAVVETTAFGAVAAIAGLIAVAFFIAAAFVWAEREYGAITACFAFGGAFIVIALIAIVVLIVLRRRREEEIRRQAASLANPANLLYALNISRALGGKQAASLALVGAFLAGLILSKAAPKRDD